MASYDLYIEDDSGRTLAILNENGDIAVSRFPDMSKDMKDRVVELYIKATGEEEARIRDFLDYNSTENEFCS